MLKHKRPSGGFIIAVVALFVALGGTATAAKLITGKQIKNNSITGVDIKDGSLGPRDVGNLDVTKVSVSGDVPNGQIITIKATCPSGYALSGGGFGAGANDIVYADGADASTYEVAVGNFTQSLPTASGHATAICVQGYDGLGTTVSRLANGEKRALIEQALAAHGVR